MQHGTAGMRLTRCSTLAEDAWEVGVTQYLTWGLGIIDSFSFHRPCRSGLSWCLWYFSIKESGFFWGQQARFFSPCSRFIWISDSPGCQWGCSEFCQKNAFRRTACSPLTLFSKQQQQKIVLVPWSLKKSLRQALSSDTWNLAVLQRTGNETFALVNVLIEGSLPVLSLWLD